jgi:hypothetical protein
MGNAEYTFTLHGDLDLVLFYDAGMAYEDREASIRWEDIKTSAGIGFKLDEDGLRVNVIQRLDDSQLHDPMVQLRIKRMF